MSNKNIMDHCTTNHFQCTLDFLLQQSICFRVSQPPHNIKKLISGPIMLKTDGQMITRIMKKNPSSHENYRSKMASGSLCQMVFHSLAVAADKNEGAGLGRMGQCGKTGLDEG